MRRRSALAAVTTLAGTAIAGVVSRPGGNDPLLAAAREGRDDIVTETTRLLPDTVHETTLYELTAPEPGPTVIVFGGVHGDERNGIEAAHDVTEWAPDAGRLVVVPETDRVAVENDERGGVDGDLNRHFPANQDPTSDLARGIWNAVERYDPDVVLDLHRSLGIYGFHQEYVGQTLFHSTDAHGRAIANALTADAVPWYLPFHRFTSQESTAGGPLLFQKAAAELDATSYLFETTAFLLDHATMTEQSRLATAHVLAAHGGLEYDTGIGVAGAPESGQESETEPDGGTNA
ncbi:succinylglutamate desuccinylase/aspartoacylase [Natrialba chahannaoensis JCM 10990]|uniref:Succinylglutamate desuccinylase/aspartoacylase n=1 Tax=Natrialba chahannaoensis JCM 10990 TaxID=1227492 RepID=M0AT26_9EURY|nr:succinylglutamate desuccinylase/aspartoacylase family protein [Natrialba chahannaoensis]ELZ01098.1 succinylglutamate desuccinylase/aspartoacylase [Natrialba chahannaoensis JCM 10990]